MYRVIREEKTICLKREEIHKVASLKILSCTMLLPRIATFGTQHVRLEMQ